MTKSRLFVACAVAACAIDILPTGLAAQTKGRAGPFIASINSIVLQDRSAAATNGAVATSQTTIFNAFEVTGIARSSPGERSNEPSGDTAFEQMAATSRPAGSWRLASSDPDQSFAMSTETPSLSAELLRRGVWLSDESIGDATNANLPDFRWTMVVDPQSAGDVAPAAVPLPPAFGVALVTFGFSVYLCRRHA